MKKPLRLSLVLITLLVLGFAQPEKASAQLVCEQANGLNWCYNPDECGQPCNDVCAAGGMAPIPDNEVWFEAQNDQGECIAISQAFGLGNNVIMAPFSTACLADSITLNHGPGLIAPLLCSTSQGCPQAHRRSVDFPGVPCDSPNAAQRSICPCVNLTFTLTPEEAVNPLGTEHTVTATLITNGVPDAGKEISFFIVSGPNFNPEENFSERCTPEDCITDENGQVSWTYTSELEGTDTIVALITRTSTFTNNVEKT